MIEGHFDIAVRRRPFTPAELDRIRAAIDPGATVADVHPLVGGIDTAVYALRLVRSGGARGDADRAVVLRVYRGPEDDPKAVERVCAIMRSLSATTALAPRLILCDAAGDILGEPLIALTMIEGAPVAPPQQAEQWTERLADGLVAIHNIPLASLEGIEADRSVPERLRRRLADPPPEPDELWDEVARVLPRMAERLVGNPATLLHGDLWFGNTVWRDGDLKGIIDWDGARIGDPARDVAVARTDLRLFGGEHCADMFRARYEESRGRLSDLLFWDLLAALGPIRWLTHYVIGYQELGVALTLAEARAKLERWVRSDIRTVVLE